MAIEIFNSSSAPPAQSQSYPLMQAQMQSTSGALDTADLDILAKYQRVSLSVWASLVSDGRTPAQIFAYLKAANPNISIRNYISLREHNKDGTSTVGTQSAVRDKINAESQPGEASWWLVTATNAKIEDFPGQWLVNFSQNVTADGNGKYFWDYYADRVFEADGEFGSAMTGLDGIFIDLFRKGSSDAADWNGNSVDAAVGSAESIDEYSTGHERFVTRLRSNFQTTHGASAIIEGNVGTWQTDTGTDPLGVNPFPYASDLLDSGMIEFVIGPATSWISESFSTWSNVRSWCENVFSRFDGGSADCSIWVDTTPGGGMTEYEILRYGLTFSLCISDGGCVVSWNSNAGPPRYYDELDNAGRDSPGWLGVAVDARQTSARWAQGPDGVWGREFEHGFVIHNPKGNGQQTITAPAGLWQRINGTQDPTVNDGTPVGSTITIPERSGLILRRVDGGVLNTTSLNFEFANNFPTGPYPQEQTVGTGIGRVDISWRDGYLASSDDPNWPTTEIDTVNVYEGTESMKLTVPGATGVNTSSPSNSPYRTDIRLTTVNGIGLLREPNSVWKDETLWVGFAVRLGEGWPLPGTDDTNTVIWQIHDESYDYPGDPYLSVDTSPSVAVEIWPINGVHQWVVSNEYNTPASTNKKERIFPFTSGGDYTNDIGQWVRFVVQVYLSPEDPSVSPGFVRVWKNGVLVVDQSGVTTFVDQPRFGYQTFSCYRTGHRYRDHSGVFLNLDSMRIAADSDGGNYTTVNPDSYL